MNEVPNEKNMPDEVGTIEDLIQHSLNQDYNKASQVFGNVMTVKMDDMLNQEKVKIANQIHNHINPEDEKFPPHIRSGMEFFRALLVGRHTHPTKVE